MEPKTAEAASKILVIDGVRWPWTQADLMGLASWFADLDGHVRLDLDAECRIVPNVVRRDNAGRLFVTGESIPSADLFLAAVAWYPFGGIDNRIRRRAPGVCASCRLAERALAGHATGKVIFCDELNDHVVCYDGNPHDEECMPWMIEQAAWLCCAQHGGVPYTQESL